MEHKIGLCADDVVLRPTNSSRSLKAADSALQEFGRVSYYEINADKSLILGVHTSPSQQALLHASECLGIRLPAKNNAVFHNNYKPWLTSMPAELQAY